MQGKVVAGPKPGLVDQRRYEDEQLVRYQDIWLDEAGQGALLTAVDRVEPEDIARARISRIQILAVAILLNAKITDIQEDICGRVQSGVCDVTVVRVDEW